MDEQRAAKILSHDSNSGIVQMPGRKFPGIVIQGDSLFNLFEQVRYCLELAKQHQDRQATCQSMESHLRKQKLFLMILFMLTSTIRIIRRMRSDISLLESRTKDEF